MRTLARVNIAVKVLLVAFLLHAVIYPDLPQYQGKGIGWLAEHYNWDAALIGILGCTFMAVVLLAFTWKLRPRSEV